MKYGIGTQNAQTWIRCKLMNSAGIMPFDDHRMFEQFSELNASCTYKATDDYFYITLIGLESNLEDICQLMTRQTLMPKLDEKQLNRVVGMEISNRFISEKKSTDVLSSALLDYVLYKDKSDYIDRLSLKDVYFLTISELTVKLCGQQIMSWIFIM